MAVAVLKRVVRREMHSPRTVAAASTAVVVALGAVYAGVEIVLRLLGAGPLLVAPSTALAWATSLPDAEPRAAVIAGAVVVTAVGLILLWLALAPGRRPKHRLGVSGHAIIVDNEVIASAVAEQVRRELDLPRGGVVVGVSHHDADVTVRPGPGQRIDRSDVRRIAEGELAGYGSTPKLRVRARILSATATEGAS